jgi:hypothetical protein
MSGRILKARAGKADDREQVVCLTGDAGHEWIHCYDSLPPTVRRRLRNSPYDICAACLTSFILPKVLHKFPRYSYEKALMVAIAVMEKQIERRDEKAR